MEFFIFKDKQILVSTKASYLKTRIMWVILKNNHASIMESQAPTTAMHSTWRGARFERQN